MAFSDMKMYCMHCWDARSRIFTMGRGRIQELEKGGAQHTVFFGPPPAWKLAQVPKKRGGGGGGGTPTLFFRSSIYVGGG